VNVGECVQTTIAETCPRLEGVDDSSSTVVYANGGSQVSDDIAPPSPNRERATASSFALSVFRITARRETIAAGSMPQPTRTGET